MKLDPDFIFCKSWYDKKYQGLSACRYLTFKAAMNLMMQRNGSTIVETGCVRLADDYGGGMSTVLFCDFLQRYGGKLWTVDINPKNIATCEQLTAIYANVRHCTVSDSVKFLENMAVQPGFNDMGGRIDLLYLDSYDYPYDVMLRDFGGKDDLNAAIQAVESQSDEWIIKHYGNIVLPCQEHCLNELKAAKPYIHQKTVILMDDNTLAGGGKTRLAKQELLRWGWQCVFDTQQTLWISP